MASLLLALPAGLASAEETDWSSADASIMSLEDLIHTVTSVSKRETKASEAASAIYVISAEDIRRSGVTSIPEALRMAPGVTVGRINANTWAISARGFSSEFSNKMLVMIDGRSVYNSLFAGTYWDAQDTVMEDIDRIEVIRGPGAALWGANAVNGVINVITKKASETQGGLSASIVGSHLVSQSLRYGGEVGDGGHYRIYGKGFKREEFETFDHEDGPDEGSQTRVGFRVDLPKGEKDKFTFSGEAYDGDTGSKGEEMVNILPFPVMSVFESYDKDIPVQGGHLLGKWDRTLSDTSSLTLSGFVDYSERKAENLGQDTWVLDLDVQHRFQPIEGNEMTWGLGYRRTEDDIDNSFQISFTPDSEEMDLYSGFIQDEQSLLDDTLRLTLGAKVENNHFTDWEFQPSARGIWFPSEGHALWAAASRAVQTRSRIDNFKLYTFVNPEFGPPPPFPNILTIANGNLGDDGADAERVYAFELGYRAELSKQATADVALFYDKHAKQLGGNTTTDNLSASGLFTERLTILADKDKADTYGAEVSLNWLVSSSWTLGAAYTYLDVDIDDDSKKRNNPTHKINASSKLNLSNNLQFDTFLYYVDSVPQQDLFWPPGPTAISVQEAEDYLRLDLRLGWQPTENVDLSLVGENLLENSHREWGASAADSDTLVPRAGYLKLTVKF